MGDPIGAGANGRRRQSLGWSAPLCWMITLLAATLLTSVGALPGAAEPRTVFKISDTRVSEPSSLTADADHHRYWTRSRSGDSGRIFALNRSGEVSGSVRLRADLQDVRAVQYHQGSLYLADIGGQGGNRSKIGIYVISNPRPDGTSARYRSYDFRYPDRAHDARALLIDGNGRMSVITRGSKAGIYQAPAEPSRHSTNTLTRVGKAPRRVTDGLTLSDGRIAVRAPKSVRILDPQRHYKLVGRAATPEHRSGTALGKKPGGRLLLVGNSDRGAAVYSMPVPDKIDKTPASGTPTAGRTASASGSPDTASPSASTPTAESSDVDTGGIGGWGMTISVIVAAVVAAAAGIVTYRFRDRSG